METKNNSLLVRIGVAILVAALTGSVSWQFIELIEQGALIDVLAAEKRRNEDDIQLLQNRVACMERGEPGCGDRYLNSWAIRDFALVTQRLNWLEKNCVLKKQSNE